eukprot:6009667-Pleurochrysis_carterae.AAC.2
MPGKVAMPERCSWCAGRDTRKMLAHGNSMQRWRVRGMTTREALGSGLRRPRGIAWGRGGGSGAADACRWPAASVCEPGAARTFRCSLQAMLSGGSERWQPAHEGHKRGVAPGVQSAAVAYCGGGVDGGANDCGGGGSNNICVVAGSGQGLSDACVRASAATSQATRSARR